MEIIAFWVGSRILDHFYPQVRNSIFNQKVDSLVLISDLVFAGAVGIVGFLWLQGKYGWFKRSSEQQEKSEKYDAKKINNNIFKKLARIEFMEDREGRLTFKIPRDERAFAHRTSGTYASWLVESAGHKKESDFNQIEYAIPDLNIGEKYLKSSYTNVCEKWQEIKKIVDEYNKKREDFINKLGSMFEKEFNSQFPDFMEYGTLEKNLKKRFYFPKKNFGKNVYRLNEIEKLLYKALTINSEDKSSSTFSRLSLQKDSYDDHYWWSLAFGNSRLMTAEDSKKLDVEKIRKILVNITNDFKTIQQFFEVRLLLDPSKIDKLYDFRDKIEDEVVSDIDNQV